MDSQFERCRDFGYIDIPNNPQCCFNLWENNNQPVPVQCSRQPVDAYWAGRHVIVKFDSGEVRRYHGSSSSAYEIVIPTYQ